VSRTTTWAAAAAAAVVPAIHVDKPATDDDDDDDDDDVSVDDNVDHSEVDTGMNLFLIILPYQFISHELFLCVYTVRFSQ